MSEVADLFEVRRARSAPGLLRAFNDIGLLSAADVHVATRLTTLAGETDPEVALAVALAVRAPRMGHVYVDLRTIRDTAAVESEEPVDLTGLPWPDPADWRERVARSHLTADGDDAVPRARPLRLVGTSLYLDRYWREERRLAADIATLAEHPAAGVDADTLEEGLARIFGDDSDDRQRAAAQAAVQRRFTVVAGGPGTGKTTTVARIVALLAEQAKSATAPAPLVALAAPTGKAAARLVESVHHEAAGLPVDETIKASLLELEAQTLHRLLGWRPGSHSRFRHHRGNRLPHDVVIVDETSMVSLSMMARLVEAVRPDARLILVGDPGQLTSIEAGAVLGDIAGPAKTEGRLAGSVVVLDRVHRYGEAIAAVAEAIRRGDAEATMEALDNSPEAVTWIPLDAAEGDPPGPIRKAAVEAGKRVAKAAAGGDSNAALQALAGFRLLCAHRRGAHGAATWNSRAEGWLADAIPDFGTGGLWYVGRPLLVTENDYGLRLYNGDTGVIVARNEGRAVAAFERRGGLIETSPSRLGAIETVYAMTVHKSQGSQFDTAAVLLPPPTSPILTRELLYTAITRAREKLIVAGTEQSIRAAVERPIARASGLGRRLWD